MTEWLHFHFSLSRIGEGNGNPLQCSCLENPRDGGAWWAAVSGVAQSRTWLKWLSSGIPQLKKKDNLKQSKSKRLKIKERPRHIKKNRVKKKEKKKAKVVILILNNSSQKGSWNMTKKKHIMLAAILYN